MSNIKTTIVESGSGNRKAWNVESYIENNEPPKSTLPDYMTLECFSYHLTLAGITNSRFVSEMPIRPGFNIVTLKSDFCPKDVPFDLVNVYYNGQGQSWFCVSPDYNFRSTFVASHSKETIPTFGDLLKVVGKLTDKNKNAALLYQGRPIDPADTIHLPMFTWEVEKEAVRFVLFPSTITDSKFLLEKTKFNKRLINRAAFEHHAMLINRLPNNNEDVRIQFARDCYLKGKYDTRYYTFYFVGEECFTDIEDVNKRWPNQSVLIKYWGDAKGMKSTFVDCYDPETQVSIKRCILTSDQLAPMRDYFGTYHNLDGQLEKAKEREQKCKDILTRLDCSRRTVMDTLEIESNVDKAICKIGEEYGVKSVRVTIDETGSAKVGKIEIADREENLKPADYAVVTLSNPVQQIVSEGSQDRVDDEENGTSNPETEESTEVPTDLVETPEPMALKGAKPNETKVHIPRFDFLAPYNDYADMYIYRFDQNPDGPVRLQKIKTCADNCWCRGEPVEEVYQTPKPEEVD